MEIYWERGSCWNEEGTVSKIRAARTVAEHGVQIQASLRVSVVQVVGREQPMALRAHVAHLQLQVPAQLTLDRQIVLGRILTSHFRLKLAEQQNGAEHAPVHRRVPWRIQDTVDSGQLGQAEWIGIRKGAALVLERRVKHGVKREGTSAKGRTGPQTFQPQ